MIKGAALMRRKGDQKTSRSGACRTSCSQEGSRTTVLEGSVDAFERLFELDERLLSFQLSPQDDRPPLEPADFREAIVLHHPREACERIARAAGINSHHTVSLHPTATRQLSSIAHGHDAVNELQSGMRVLRASTLRGHPMHSGFTTAQTSENSSDVWSRFRFGVVQGFCLA
jgi:hypothetical protein